MTYSPATRLRRGIAVAIASVALAGGLAGCSAEADEPASAQQPRGDGSPSATFDPLPDPGVPAGACAMVTYTPPGAPTPQEAQLCRPADPATQRDAGVVLLHGGSGVGGSYTDLKGWVDAYLGAGYVTLDADYELFSSSTDSPVFPRPEQDVKAAIQYLRGVSAAVGLNPDRIAVHGSSAGARIGAVAFTTPNDEAFVGPDLWEGIPDTVNAFIGFYHPYDGSLQQAATYYGGERDDRDPAVQVRWMLADALLNGSKASGPALLLTGDQDWEIQITQAQQLADAVTAAGHPSTVSVVKDGEHGYDLAGGELTTKGKQSAFAVLAWLDEQFPAGG